MSGDFESPTTCIRAWIWPLRQEHWAAVTGIPLSQFRKPYRAVPDSSIRTAKHPMGCASVVYSCSATHREIVGMMAALLSSMGP